MNSPTEPMLDLTGEMSQRQIADALDAMIFTAAHGWTRTVKIDGDVRDLIVTTLRAAYGGNQDKPPNFRQMRGILKGRQDR